ncbi:LysR family transcriptional regulator [Ancylobacter terrae]|uniref:LysR family transcriptional regulator n=1 Tax=Ancylobacter sp. sgz301288 TaxID=3342077 RepID=UPI003858427B
MTLKQLEALYWSAVLGSFALAAERLFMTRSALSKRIQELEAEVGEPLFDRSGASARITEVGERVFAKAEQMLALCDEILVAADAPQRVKGTCRFGISELMAMQWLPRIVSEVRAAYPDVVIEPRVAVTRELLEDVERGETDFALCAGTSPDPQVQSEQIGRVELHWVAAPGLPIEGGILTAETLQTHPVISMSVQAGSTINLQNFSSESGLKFRRIVASNSPEAVAAVTIAGLGIALLAGPFVERFIRSGELVRLTVEDRLRVPDLAYALHWRADNGRLLARTVRDIARRICTADGAAPAA